MAHEVGIRLTFPYLLYRYFLEGLRTHVKQLSTLVKLLVCHTVTVSHMSDRREGSLRRPEEKETAGALGFNLILWVKQIEECGHAKNYPIYFYFSVFILLSFWFTTYTVLTLNLPVAVCYLNHSWP